MNKLTFVQLYAENKDTCAIFEQLMWQYTDELEEHRDRKTPTDVIARWIKSIIQMQGERDRHLELCYDGSTLIGFLYGKVDHPEHKGFIKVGYGYIMEFFVLSAYRRKGYGKEMYIRLEKLFGQDGVKRMYLTADPITGKPFWESLGFVNTGEKSPENNLEIYEKQVFSDNRRTVKIIKYPDDALVCSIAKQHGRIADQVISGLTHVISRAHYRSDFFCTVMYSGEDVIGLANFIQSSAEPSKWFYTDLWVASAYRRQGCATEMVTAGLQHLSELCAKTLLCTVDRQNEASLHVQRALGFEQIPTQPFEDFEVDAEGLVMFSLDVPKNYNILPLADNLNHLLFICNLLTHPSNALALHLKPIADDEILPFRIEMREELIFKEPDNEVNYIIRKGILPIAWLKLNGLSSNSLWISMLVVHEKYRRLGVGMHALRFAEAFARESGRRHIYLHTTADNQAALALYKKTGFSVTAEAEQQYEDGQWLTEYTLHKEIVQSFPK